MDGKKIMEKKAIIIMCLFLIALCAGVALKNLQFTPQEVLIKIESNQPIEKVEIANDDNKINRSMEVPNPEGRLSGLSFIAGGKAFSQIYSGITVADVTRFWNDVTILLQTTKIREINVFINSPGGDAFSGLALADEIERAKRAGFEIIGHASGIVASAAVPVFAVCGKRYAAPGTIFMVHEASLWKWPGQETASDIRSQNELMDLLRDRYMAKLIENSKLTKEKWCELERKTTWFNVETAVEWGLVDEIN